MITYNSTGFNGCQHETVSLTRSVKLWQPMFDGLITVFNVDSNTRGGILTKRVGFYYRKIPYVYVRTWKVLIHYRLTQTSFFTEKAV